MTADLRCWLAVALVAEACGNVDPASGREPVIGGVLPDTWRQGAEPPSVEIIGSGFYVRVISRPGSRPQTDSRFVAALGDGTIGQLRWISNSTLAGTPPSLSAGTYDLELSTPGGQRAQAAAAVVVMPGDETCDELFGRAESYAACAETPTTCTFASDIGIDAPSGLDTCRAQCQRFGRECVGAWDNPPGNVCEILGVDDCDTPRATEICECAR